MDGEKTHAAAEMEVPSGFGFSPFVILDIHQQEAVFQNTLTELLFHTCCIYTCVTEVFDKWLLHTECISCAQRNNKFHNYCFGLFTQN